MTNVLREIGGHTTEVDLPEQIRWKQFSNARFLMIDRALPILYHHPKELRARQNATGLLIGYVTRR